MTLAQLILKILNAHLDEQWSVQAVALATWVIRDEAPHQFANWNGTLH